MVSRRKVAFVSAGLPPTWSGQSVVLSRLLSRIDPDRLVLITSQHVPEDSESCNLPRLASSYYTTPAGTWMIRIGRIFHFGRRLFDWRVRVRARQIARVVRHEQAEAIVACSGDIADIPAAWYASKHWGIPLLLYLFDDYELQWWFHEPLRHYAGHWLRRIATDVEAAICPCEPLADRIAGLGYSTCIIRNPYGYDPADRPDRTVRSPDQPIRIVFTGAVYGLNIDAIQNLLMAIDRLDRPIELHIYTAQPAWKLGLQGLPTRKLVIHPHVPPEAASRIQQQADLLLMPFTFDPARRSIVQTSATGKLGDYLISGRPILAHMPESCYVAKRLAEHDCGEVITTVNVATVAESLAGLMEDPPRQQRFVRHAVALARQQFNPDLMAERLGEVMFG
jgi:glycosyltransferase involved in cell wall biosynthesis